LSFPLRIQKVPHVVFVSFRSEASARQFIIPREARNLF